LTKRKPMDIAIEFSAGSTPMLSLNEHSRIPTTTDTKLLQRKVKSTISVSIFYLIESNAFGLMNGSCSFSESHFSR